MSVPVLLAPHLKWVKERSLLFEPYQIYPLNDLCLLLEANAVIDLGT